MLQVHRVLIQFLVALRQLVGVVGVAMLVAPAAVVEVVAKAVVQVQAQVVRDSQEEQPSLDLQMEVVAGAAQAR
jgi:hypothetical protein